MGTGCGSGVILGHARQHVAGGDACDAVDCHREVVPRNRAFVAKVIYARMPLFAVDERFYHAGEVKGLGWSAHLVADHTQCLTAAPKFEHGLHKVLAMRRVEPCCADDDAIGGNINYMLLAIGFGAAINRSGTHWVVFTIWAAVCAVIHIVGGDVNEFCAILVCCLCEQGGSFIV